MSDFPLELDSVHHPATDNRDLLIEQKNLSDLHTRLTHLLICDTIHSDEAAELFLGAESSVPPDLSQTARCLERDFLLQDSDESTDPRLQCVQNGLRLIEQLSLSRAVASRFSPESTALAEALFGHPEPITPAAEQRIAYQRNIYTDEAFLHFARALPHEGRAQYTDSFSDVCEQVYSGQCEFCILPLESTQEGKLLRFYSMIERYELKIAMACEVTASDNRHTTTFGLCRRSILPEDMVLSSQNRRFSMILREDMVHLHLQDVLSAADMCGLHLLRADCLPRSDDEIVMGAGYPFNLNFSCNEENGEPFDLRTFLVYLALFAPSYLPLGIYRHL